MITIKSHFAFSGIDIPSTIRFQLLYYLFTIFRLSFHNNNIILNDWET